MIFQNSKEASLNELDYEQGPIRPPSESRSLFIRVMRNCTWNRCAFCPVYKGTAFSKRSLKELRQDIEILERMNRTVDRLIPGSQTGDSIDRTGALALLRTPGLSDAFRAFILWRTESPGHVFLQDADGLVMKTADLTEILTQLTGTFPIGRITSYSRATTLSRLGARLHQLRKAGLTRIHIGLESGHPDVLLQMVKGSGIRQFIEAARWAHDAGIEISVYVMPGLAGTELWREHAIQTAELVCRMAPAFVRLRTLAIAESTPLFNQWRNHRFSPMKEIEILEEIHLFLENLKDYNGIIESDHSLNLLQDLKGHLPRDLPSMQSQIRSVLSLDPTERTFFIIGRRIGVIRDLDDLKDNRRRTAIQTLIDHWAEENIPPEDAIGDIMSHFL